MSAWPSIDSLGPAARGRRLDTFGLLTESRPDDDLRARLEQRRLPLHPRPARPRSGRRGREDLLAQPELTQTYPMRSDADARRSSTARASWASSTGCSGPRRAATTSSGCAISHPSHGIAPHCDTVFMGRGTPDVLTAWIPFGDIPIRAGGLMVLEHSHHSSRNSASPTTCDRTSTATARTARTPTRSRRGDDEVGALARAGPSGTARSPRTRTHSRGTGTRAG